MVMNLYQGIYPKYPSNNIYTLSKHVCDEDIVLGIFDELETVLHALDVVSKFRANDLKIDDFFDVRRNTKNTLDMKPISLVTWTCTAEPKNGCYFGVVEFRHGLRTHDVET